ncbi:hypothetical protein B0T13DRAFT_506105 [Neurospora crassa]|nr:hypothetical protein B0T13DRAFT_506105 [Neurospora crassa]
MEHHEADKGINDHFTSPHTDVRAFLSRALPLMSRQGSDVRPGSALSFISTQVLHRCPNSPITAYRLPGSLATAPDRQARQILDRPGSLTSPAFEVLVGEFRGRRFIWHKSRAYTQGPSDCRGAGFGAFCDFGFEFDGNVRISQQQVLTQWMRTRIESPNAKVLKALKSKIQLTGFLLGEDEIMRSYTLKQRKISREFLGLCNLVGAHFCGLRFLGLGPWGAVLRSRRPAPALGAGPEWRARAASLWALGCGGGGAENDGRCGSVVVSSPFLAPAILSNEPRRTAQTAWASALAELGGARMGIR